ncbi:MULTISPECIES: hypothetical protein [Sinorhizobium]|uniref:hypothetical protein n=1 Tax=Sinorhizobium TaxID=28105 RepID=UPI000FDB35F3|nr:MULTISPECIES: hypothetical protein [Sinorhizobium]RVG90383.1 hypothetical protein CN218_23615 [Sinorhizobium meliloti]RVI03670.1 hypothetical protein CN205_22490 [Sinorhizobium meliloti]RVK97521.1 hypothetical protein CN150_10675 [Sinorhizobium meliloti]RVO22998.1 hypothetical protein CN095_32990 [Sinorhizobium meliloti]WQO53826.1 hypothetical protein U8C36_09710 [Sinorhizobium medicae]
MSDLLDLQAQATDKVTSGQVKAAIAAMHSPPSHQTFFEVSNATGYGIKSYADAISMGVWPSTGNEIHGFEVKVSRSDFLNEMKNPEKAMPIMQYCHRWSLVCPASMVKLDEVPATWGVYWYKGGALKKARQAPLLEAKPLTAAFVAALVRRAGEADFAVVNKAVNDARAKWEEGKQREIESEVRRRVGSRDAATDLLEAMEAEYGRKLNEWDLQSLCKAVAVAARLGLHESWSSPVAVLSTIEDAASRMREVLSGVGIDLPKSKRRSA